MAGAALMAALTLVLAALVVYMVWHHRLVERFSDLDPDLDLVAADDDDPPREDAAAPRRPEVEQTPWIPRRALKEHATTPNPHGVLFTPDGEHLLVAGQDLVVYRRLEDGTTFREHRRLSFGKPCYALALSFTGLLGVTHADGVMVLDLFRFLSGSGTPVMRQAAVAGASALAFSLDGALVAVAGDEAVVVLDAVSLAPRYSVPGMPAGVAWLPAGAWEDARPALLVADRAAGVVRAVRDGRVLTDWPAGCCPGGMERAGEATYVAVEAEDSVRVLGPDPKAIPVGPAPVALRLALRDSVLLVVASNRDTVSQVGQVDAIEVATGARLTSYAVGKAPMALAVHEDLAVITCSASDTLCFLSLGSDVHSDAYTLVEGQPEPQGCLPN